MINFIIYGIVDNGIMILGAMTGLSLEKYLPKKLKRGLGAVIGAGLGNACSDFLGGMSTLSYSLAIGTCLGCLIGLIFIPLLVMVGKLRQQKKEY
tara:strand:+ start:871 stop:1155 length:285 start_codon:yes stop_codon:yes gene_type:complete